MIENNGAKCIVRILLALFSATILSFAGCKTDDQSQNGMDLVKSASYLSKTQTFTVKFVDYNGKIIEEKTYSVDERVTVPADPTRPDDEKKTYKFIGWDPEVDYESKQDQIYVADYEEAYKHENADISKEDLYAFAKEVASCKAALEQIDFIYNNFKNPDAYDYGKFEYVEANNPRFIFIQVGCNELNKSKQQTLYVYSPDSVLYKKVKWIYRCYYTDPDTTESVDIGSDLEKRIEHPEEYYKYKFNSSFYASDTDYKSDKTDYWMDLTDYIRENPELLALYTYNDEKKTANIEEKKEPEKTVEKEEQKQDQKQKPDYIYYTEAHNYYGQNQRVFGRVTSIGTNTNKGRTMYFINMGQDFKSANHFAGIVYPEVFCTLGFDLNTLVGKNVIISGTVQK